MALGCVSVSPHGIFGRRSFQRVALEPPSAEPGSWRGAGKAAKLGEREYVLSARPRTRERRGYAVEVYTSSDGLAYSPASSLAAEEVSRDLGARVYSIENSQLLVDPATGDLLLYISVDLGPHYWETALYRSDDPKGPWRPEGLVIRRDRPYDSKEARDCTIDYVDGLFVALCKAVAEGDPAVRTELAVSRDGVSWAKLGLPTVNGGLQPARPAFLLNGRILPSAHGPMFVGSVTLYEVGGAHVTRHVGAYVIDLDRLDLREVYMAEWRPSSPYEREDYPIHTYVDVLPDYEAGRWLLYVEAIDPSLSKGVGVDVEVDRLLAYSSPMQGCSSA